MKKNEFRFHIQLNAGDLWRFSMYHANKGYLGIFNVLFTLAAASQLLFRWNELTVPYRFLFAVCAMIFTVWQPGLLYLKAAKQSKNQAMAQPMELIFSGEGLKVVQGEQEGEASWDQVSQVRRGFGQYIVYMGRVRAYLLPDRIVGEEKTAFAAFVHETLPKERCKRV